MRSHLSIRLAAATALLAGGLAGAVATASPAAASIPVGGGCQGQYERYTNYGVEAAAGGGNEVFVTDIYYCTPGPGPSLYNGVTISKYVGTSWVVVASGSGTAFYDCTGGQYLYTTSVTTNEGKPAFYCG